MMNRIESRPLVCACIALIMIGALESSYAQVASSLERQPAPLITLEKIILTSDKLPPARRELLDAAAQRIERAREGGSVNLLAVCTHNSRRSQFCQAWSGLALAHYKVSGVESFSCGTEATACNVRTVSALERNGWQIQSPAGRQLNPHYVCTYGDSASVTLWSKAFGDPSLPTAQIVALLCCDDADKACPSVPGAVARVPLHYVDPKVSDDTAQEAAVYDERCQQIAAEMFYMIRQLSTTITTR